MLSAYVSIEKYSPTYECDTIFFTPCYSAHRALPFTFHTGPTQRKTNHFRRNIRPEHCHYHTGPTQTNTNTIRKYITHVSLLLRERFSNTRVCDATCQSIAFLLSCQSRKNSNVTRINRMHPSLHVREPFFYFPCELVLLK